MIEVIPLKSLRSLQRTGTIQRYIVKKMFSRIFLFTQEIRKLITFLNKRSYSLHRKKLLEAGQFSVARRNNGSTQWQRAPTQGRRPATNLFYLVNQNTGQRTKIMDEVAKNRHRQRIEGNNSLFCKQIFLNCPQQVGHCKYFSSFCYGLLHKELNAKKYVAYASKKQDTMVL